MESPRGKLKFKAKLTPKAMPEVVNIPMGLGHKAFGRWANGIGENVGQLMATDTDSFTGESLLQHSRVKVYKA